MPIIPLKLAFVFGNLEKIEVDYFFDTRFWRTYYLFEKLLFGLCLL